MPKLGFYEAGTWNAVCDECGLGFKFNRLSKRWDNALVCRQCWEPRQPQDFVRAVRDDPSVPIARPRIGGSGGITTTTSSLTSSSTSVNITDATAFPGSGSSRLLLVLFDPTNPAVTETVSGTYSAGASTVNSMHRGLNGSSALAWASGVTIQYVGTTSS